MKLTKQQEARQQVALQALRGISAKLPGAEEYVMVHHPAFRVGKKPFAIAGMDEAERGPTVSINLGHDAQGHLLGDDRFYKTPYLGQHGWVTVSFHALAEAELRTLVLDSYRRIAGKKLLALLDEEPTTTRPTPARPARRALKPKRTASKRAPAKAKRA